MDSIFVYVQVIDRDGMVVPTNGLPITLKVYEAATTVGHETVKTRDGLTSFLIQSNGRKGSVRIIAQSKLLN